MKMHGILLTLITVIGSVKTFYTSDYEENTPRLFIEKLNEQDINEDEHEREPVNPLTSVSTKKGEHLNVTVTTPIPQRNIWCEDFEEYSKNCTKQSGLIYKSMLSLPLAHQLGDWCKALKSLATCEYEWNVDCKDVTEKHFNDLAIKGQLHVLDKVCHDDWFAVRYDTNLDKCIKAVSKAWTECYKILKFHTDQRKNSTNNWVHYETHFHLCCARTRYRRCTLELLLNFTDDCTSQQMLLLQKFSSIISEGEVFQDCNFNMMWAECPGGDPRPAINMISKLMGDKSLTVQHLRSSALRSVPASFLPMILTCQYIFK